MKSHLLIATAIILSGFTPTTAFAQESCEDNCVEVIFPQDPYCSGLNTQDTYYLHDGFAGDSIVTQDGPVVFAGKSGNATVLRRTYGGASVVFCLGFNTSDEMVDEQSIQLSTGQDSTVEVQVCQNVGGKPAKQGVAIDPAYANEDCSNPRA